VLPGTSSPERLGKAVVDESPFGVGEIASVSHPQSAGVSDQKSTVKSENFFSFLEFSNTLLADEPVRAASLWLEAWLLIFYSLPKGD
jgi:hypothetical protein